MAEQKDGDRIIVKRSNSEYDVLKIEGVRITEREHIHTLDEAKAFARLRLPEGGIVWYRDHRDAADDLERV